jgi:anti-sigma factor RsiW
MNEHDAVRSLLALAAAGALDNEEQARVSRHTAACSSCRQELEAWGGYAAGMRRLGQPHAPAWLAERTHARILRQRSDAAERRRRATTLVALSLFAWSVSLATWLGARVLAGNSVAPVPAEYLQLSIWSLGSTVLVWMTVTAAAVMLAKRPSRARRLL